MKPDIASREDLLLLVTRFYDKLLADASISHFFVRLNLDEHLPLLADFWEMILFQQSGYRNNPMAAHLALHQTTPIENHHFETWLRYFNETVNEYFSGPAAEMAKERALSIATVMRIKIAELKQPH